MSHIKDMPELSIRFRDHSEWADHLRSNAGEPNSAGRQHLTDLFIHELAIVERRLLILKVTARSRSLRIPLEAIALINPA